MNLMTDWLVSTASSRYPGMQKKTLSREWRKGKTYFHFKQLLFVYLNCFPFNIYLTDYLLCTRHFSWSWLWVRQTGLPWIQFNIFVRGKETKSAYKRWLEKDKGWCISQRRKEPILESEVSQKTFLWGLMFNWRWEAMLRAFGGSQTEGTAIIKVWGANWHG